MKYLFALVGVVLALSSAQAQSTSNTVVYLNDEENRVFVLLNQFRAQLNLPQLQIHVAIQSAAKKHSEWMASVDTLNHYGPVNYKTPALRMSDEGYPAAWSGENIACGYADGTKTFKQWAFSPGHLANLINPNYRHMGISRAGTGRENCPYYWTNDFGSFIQKANSAPPITDIALINRAYEAVMGPLNGTTLKLPGDPFNQGTVTQPAPATEVVEDTEIQCTIPSKLGKGIVSFYNDVSTVLEAKGNSRDGYKIKLVYIQDGDATSLYPLTINGVSVVKNKSYPLYVIFSPQTNRTGSFAIQFNTQTNQAQFDSFGSTTSSNVSGEILCVLKNN